MKFLFLIFVLFIGTMNTVIHTQEEIQIMITYQKSNTSNSKHYHKSPTTSVTFWIWMNEHTVRFRFKDGH